METAKKTRGRQKVEMKAIGDESKRHVAFSKRKAGLFNKAAELNVLTGAEVAAIIFSRQGKAYTFGTPAADSVVAAWLNRLAGAGAGISFPPGVEGGDAGDPAGRELRRLEDANRRLAERRRRAEAAMGRLRGCLGFWWELPESSMETAEELETFAEALAELRMRVEERVAAAAELTRRTTSFSALIMGGGDGGGGGEEEIVNGLIVSSPSSELYN